MDERDLAARLIAYDTADPDGIRLASGFVKGWLEARDFAVDELELNGLPVLAASNGGSGPTVVLHGHIDVVPGHSNQFDPRIEGDRLIGRGAYDMKGALATMMLALHDLAGEPNAHVRFLCVPDEESEKMGKRGTDLLIEHGYTGDFAITGEPTELLIGVQAKGVLALKLTVCGTAAHGSTPWLGDNAVLKAVDAVRTIEALPFTRESTDLFDRPSINLGRISGGDAINKVPDICEVDVDIRYLPGQNPLEIVAAIEAIPDIGVEIVFEREPAYVSRSDQYVKALAAAIAKNGVDKPTSVGRDGSSEATIFLAQGIPAVEFGPVGGGHHGPEEWVSLDSLTEYRKTLVAFVRSLAAHESGKLYAI